MYILSLKDRQPWSISLVEAYAAYTMRLHTGLYEPSFSDRHEKTYDLQKELVSQEVPLPYTNKSS